MNLDVFLKKMEINLDNFSDYLLPSAVNESKQLINSKAFSSIYLVGAISFILIALVLFVFSQNNEMSGQTGFILFSSIMDIGLVFLIPTMMYQNMSNERSNGSFELMAITSISPLKIVLGKWQSGLLQAIIFGSLIMPGLVYSYFFNGVNLWLICISLILTMLTSQLTILIAIFFCSIGLLKSSRVFFQIVSIAFSLFMVISLIAFKANSWEGERLLKEMSTSEFWNAVLLILPIFATAELLLILVSAGQLSSYSANKSTGPRIVYSVLILELCIASIFVSDHDIKYLFAFLFFVHFVISFFFLIEKDILSRRLFLMWQKKEIGFRLIFKRFFYPGKSSAYLLFLIQTFIFYGCILFGPLLNSSSIDDNFYKLVSAILYCFLFYDSCIFLVLTVLHKLIPAMKIVTTVMISIFILVMIFLVPTLLSVTISEEDAIFNCLNIFHYLGYRADFSNSWPYAIFICLTVLLFAAIVAAANNKRREDEYRDFEGGERGAT